MRKQQAKKLVLNRETLVPLTADKLDGVQGGALTPPPTTSHRDCTTQPPSIPLCAGA